MTPAVRATGRAGVGGRTGGGSGVANATGEWSEVGS